MTRKNSNLVGGGISYEAPSAKTLEVIVEGVLCASYKYNAGGAGAYSYEDGTITDNGSY